MGAQFGILGLYGFSVVVSKVTNREWRIIDKWWIAFGAERTTVPIH